MSSVADPGCLSRILILPRSQISDPRSRIQKQQQRREVKKMCYHTFFVAATFKIVNYLIFDMLKKKIWSNFQKYYRTFTQKMVTKLLKIWVWDPGSNIWDPGSNVWDPGSEIWDPKKTYFVSRIQVSKRHQIPDSGSRIRNTGREGKKLTHLVSWFVSLLDKSRRTRFSVSLFFSIFSCNSREQSISV
jgi:hypothetical protein